MEKKKKKKKIITGHKGQEERSYKNLTNSSILLQNICFFLGEKKICQYQMVNSQNSWHVHFGFMAYQTVYKNGFGIK